MMISKEKFNQINNWLIILILSTIFFRSVSTALIFIFAGFNIINYSYLSFDKKNIKYYVIVAIPFLLEILFIWNDIGSAKLFKPIEKNLSFLIFPLFILSNYKAYNFYYIADKYRKITTILIIILLIRFAFIFPDFVQKYMLGHELWEMGYVITNSFGNHAPTVNMQLAFIVLLNLYFLLNNFLKNIFLNSILLLLSTFELVIVNTRLSLGSIIVCSFIMVITFAYKKYREKSIYIIIGFLIITSSILIIAFISNPYMKEKYSSVTFSNMDKIGKLDEVENPDGVLHNALVTRVTIWQSTIEVAKKNTITGYGSANAKNALFNYYKESNQKFLSKYEFPVHNQFLDYLLRFGVVGFVALVFYFIYIYRISIISKNIIGFVFTLNFLFSNLFDDYLILFSGIVFSSIWFCLIMTYYLKNNKS
ncbi:O-antigen ligase family protein [Chishuiella sp.]|uniref:O-antigen ligase family protein n=1 Tax=Chishuiella sp. TaxID=1969467 RepID=UPI0028AD6A77|nr:O-antigen ligase family protein [Chishuiella sp.]